MTVFQVRRAFAALLILPLLAVGTTQSASAGLLGSFTNYQAAGYNAKPIEATMGAIYAATGDKVLQLQEFFVFDTNASGGGTASSDFGLSYGLSLDTFNDANEPLTGSFTDLSPVTVGEYTYTALYYTSKMDAHKAGFNLYEVMNSGNAFSSDFDANGEEEWVFLNRDGTFQSQNDPANTWSSPDDPNSIVSKHAISNLRVFGLVEKNGVVPPDDSTGQVPEPASLAVFLMGSIVAFGASRRRRQQG